MSDPGIRGVSEVHSYPKIPRTLLRVKGGGGGGVTMKREAPSAQAVPDLHQSDFFAPGAEPILVMSLSPSGVLTLLIEERRLLSVPHAAVSAALDIIALCLRGEAADAPTVRRGSSSNAPVPDGCEAGSAGIGPPLSLHRKGSSDKM